MGGGSLLTEQQSLCRFWSPSRGTGGVFKICNVPDIGLLYLAVVFRIRLSGASVLSRREADVVIQPLGVIVRIKWCDVCVRVVSTTW